MTPEQLTVPPIRVEAAHPGCRRGWGVFRESLTWNDGVAVLMLALLLLLFISGAGMALYYSPVPGTAYDSVDYAQFHLPFGEVIRGVHYYAWNVLLIVMGVHLLRTLRLGAYRTPPRLVWTMGIGMGCVVPLCIITGDLLPWDQASYWSTQVRLGIIASVPWVGDAMARLLKGGSQVGIVALTRFYVLHILFLPAILISGIALYARYLLRRKHPCRTRVHMSALNPMRRDLIPWGLGFILIVTVVLGVIAWQYPAPFGDPADPTDTAYIPRPEWWVLWLNQLVTLLRGPWQIVGTTVIPGGLLMGLTALPWLDGESHHPVRRIAIQVTVAMAIIAIAILSVMGYLDHHLSPRTQ